MSEYIDIDLSNTEPNFTKLNTGRHKARITGCAQEYKEYMKSPRTKSSGSAVTWKYETFGNDDPTQNNKTIFQSTPVDGMYAKITRNVIHAALPDLKGGKFRPEDVLGKEVEIELYYNRDAKTGQERQYPNVKYVYPLIERGFAGNISDINASNFPDEPTYKENIPF